MAAVVVGLLGCGVVGGGVADRLLNDSPVRGATLDLARVLVRDLTKRRFPEAVRDHLTTSATDVLEDARVEAVVECIGGVHPAFAYVEAALRLGKHVITANKALVAEHGEFLSALAENAGLDFRYEAAVGGAMPVIRSLRHLASIDEITEVSGVVNGTTNFILTEMENGAAFDDALRDAQRDGYAESDASYDVDGIDAAQKLAILCAAGFGIWPKWDAIERRGIRAIRTGDVALAKRLGCRVKLIVRARREGRNIRASVAPELVSFDHPFAAARGAENVIRVTAKHAGPLLISGIGAGRSATASAIFSDLADTIAAHYARETDVEGPAPRVPAGVEGPAQPVPQKAENG